MRAMTRRGLAFVAAVLLFATSASAVQEELLAEARRLYAEATPLVETANNTDLAMEERRGPRKEAYQKLRKSLESIDKYLDLNPSKEAELDKERGDIYSVIYWLKKDSSLGELEKDAPPPELPAAPTAPTDGGKPGDGGTKPPAPTQPEPGPPKSETPSEYAWRAKQRFEALLDYEKAHAADLPVLKQLYEKFLGDFSDPSLPEYAAAVQKLGVINDRMKTVLKEVAKRDPDNIGIESGVEKSIFGKLSFAFRSKDPAERTRAARLMAASRSRSAAHFLVDGLDDPDEEFSTICREGLIACGGRHVGEKLVEKYRDASKEKQQAALSVLDAITKKSAVDARTQSPSIGRFVVSRQSDIAEQAIAMLIKMGKAGGPGLMAGFDSVFVEKKIDCLKAIGQVKYYKAARDIGERFLGSGKLPRELREAALECVQALGPNAVPYLIPSLGGPMCAYAVRKITGDDSIGIGNRKQASEWWKSWKAAHPEEVDEN
jgi:tetratricopeptide (TPR) repeat protein